MLSPNLRSLGLTCAFSDARGSNYYFGELWNITFNDLRYRFSIFALLGLSHIRQPLSSFYS